MIPNRPIVLSHQASEFNQYQYRVVTIEELDYIEHARPIIQKNRHVHEVKLLDNDCNFGKPGIRNPIRLVFS